MRPDRVVLGVESERAEKLLRELYRPLNLIEAPILVTNLESAELVKYASNAFLATKISFINEIANLCEHVGADVHAVARGMGMDKRIGSKFLHPGPGYGGSCFPKDTTALIRIAQAGAGGSLSNRGIGRRSQCRTEGAHGEEDPRGAGRQRGWQDHCYPWLNIQAGDG
jgi:UDPglucose 6-dehydrogenase